VIIIDDTIAAIATPLGEGAIAVLRISGPEAIAVVSRSFRSGTPTEKMASRRGYLGEILDEVGVIDQVLVSVFRKPNSYTGQDLVEISCHGGILVTRNILALMLKNGARTAEPGEFTQRAFLNGKMDLTQAEAVMDLIRAQTDLALRAAKEQLTGYLGQELGHLQDQLLTALAHVEAYIDFPDEAIEPETGKMLIGRLSDVGHRLERLVATADQGRILRHGLRTVIFGEPNVGKSSLLNVLLGYDRAIVSETPGTTRDTIEETINVRGIPVRLIDTAGKRFSQDAIEREGIRRTEEQLAQADLVLEVIDASEARTVGENDRRRAGTRENLTADKRILILNKVDLGFHPDWEGVHGVRFSCRTGEGQEALNEAIWKLVMAGGVSSEDFRVAISARHQSCLQRAIVDLQAAMAGLARNELPELIAIDLRNALDAIGDVIGRHDTEDLLGRIFSEFCIGK
jgi:tRNA modification GTPase